MTTNGSPSSPSWGHKNAWDQPTAKTVWGNPVTSNTGGITTNNTGEVFFHFEKIDETTVRTNIPPTKKPLISLKDWNQSKWEKAHPPKTPLWNGLACPKCGKEMFDVDPDYILCSLPPKTEVGCTCEFRGYRFV